MIVSPTVESIRQVADVIAGGGVIAFRTDTFYGLSADPFNQDAVRRIKQLKGREDNKPILLVVSDYDQVNRVISSISPAFNSLGKKFWPGALTLIGEARPELPAEITAGTNTVGVRLPNDDRVRLLVRACGGALTATSANPSHAAPATTAVQVQDYFGDRLDAILDDGIAQTDRPSTVVDASGNDPKLIREGVIAWSDIVTALG
ncbi:MAG TPA: L-threonylcarbamoyladenylate synthase [Pyrinomonadaceae bacterium]|jgi:L-threonylcarbamoyladenylate synthase|nr:L-threonylcarbamoyladenylate synthase [Pyrinomonadaceae bacterium]